MPIPADAYFLKLVDFLQMKIIVLSCWHFRVEILSNFLCMWHESIYRPFMNIETAST